MLKELFLRRKFFLFIFVVGIGGSFQFGFNISAINTPSEFIKNFINETWIHRYETPLQEYSLMLLWSFIVCVYPIGGLIGGQAAAVFTVKYGRKKCLLCNNIVAIGSAIIIGFSKMSRSFEMIVVGRFLYGISTGLGLVAHGLYLGDTAPKEIRGAVCLTRAVFNAIGKSMGLIVGLREFLGDENKWHLLLAFSGLPALIQLIVLPWFPESPRYLLMEKGSRALCIDGQRNGYRIDVQLNSDVCKDDMGKGTLRFIPGGVYITLQRLWGPGDYTEEVDEMMAERAQMQGATKINIVQLFSDKTIRCQLLIGMAISAGMQLSGVNIIYFYANDVYQQLGFTKDKVLYLGIGASGIEIFTSVICGFIIDRAGRKVLLWRGYSFMALWILLLIVTLSLKEYFTWIPYCSLVLIFAYIFTFGIGPGSVSGVLPLEIFTQSNRSIALVLANTLQWLCLFVLGLVFPFVVDALGPFSFFLFFGSCTFASLFMFYILPETKGKTLLQINEEFNKLREARRTMCPSLCKEPVANQTVVISTIL